MDLVEERREGCCRELQQMESEKMCCDKDVGRIRQQQALDEVVEMPLALVSVDKRDGKEELAALELEKSSETHKQS